MVCFMTDPQGFPRPEQFAAVAVAKLKADERSWPWLARQTDIHVNTLRSQLLTNPSRLKLRTANRVATALNISVWAEEAVA